VYTQQSGRTSIVIPPKHGFDPPIIGHSSAAAFQRDLVLTLTGSEVSVLVTGESGVGKEVLARNLHRFSPRHGGPFVCVNCAAFSPGTLESELFGHDRGAFTGAIRAHAGLFEQAAGGTLFLDEIGDMPPGVQARLLRVLQEGEVRRMGDEHTRRVDVRVISATNADVQRQIARGAFRLDLFYRLNVIEVKIAPLRRRAGDILDLFVHLYDRHTSLRPDVDVQAAHRLTEYHWPGNVRELENEVKRIIALHRAPARVTADMLSERITAPPPASLVLDESALYDAPLAEAVTRLEVALLVRALARSNWNKSKTARDLGLSRQGLIKKIKRYGISRPLAPTVSVPNGSGE